MILVRTLRQTLLSLFKQTNKIKQQSKVVADCLKKNGSNYILPCNHLLLLYNLATCFPKRNVHFPTSKSWAQLKTSFVNRINGSDTVKSSESQMPLPACILSLETLPLTCKYVWVSR